MRNNIFSGLTKYKSESSYETISKRHFNAKEKAMIDHIELVESTDFHGNVVIKAKIVFTDGDYSFMRITNDLQVQMFIGMRLDISSCIIEEMRHKESDRTFLVLKGTLYVTME